MRREVYEEIESILELCKAIVTQGKDPFNFNIESALKTLDGLRSNFDDLAIDSEALEAITGILESQKDWIENRVGSMLIDPMLVEFRIKAMDKDELKSLALSCYHPIASIESVSSMRLKEAVNYWNSIKRYDIADMSDMPFVDEISTDALYSMRILSDEEFGERMNRMRKELEEIERVEYRDFVNGDVGRAYILSFLITEGFVSLDIDSINERIGIVRGSKGDKSVSVAIAIGGKNG
jgi:hypothetical protein